MTGHWSFLRLIWPVAVTIVAVEVLGLVVAYRAPDLIPPVAVAVGGVLISVCVLALAVYRVERHWAGPLRRVGRTAEELTAGNWSARVDPAGGTADVNQLATRLNAVASAAGQQLAEREEQRRVMQVLVDTLPDPVLLVEGHRRVTLINSAAGRLLGVPPATAVTRWLGEVVKDRALLETFDALPPVLAGARAPAAPVEREVQLDRDGARLTYQAVATRTADGVLLVLRDVTALSETVRMKTDFVANASHELRTPVAAIKAAFETLREVYAEDPHQTERCVRIIDGHLHRLEEMLRDLLDLSRLESPDVRVELSAVRPSELFANVRAAFAEAAAAKRVGVRVDAGPDEPFTGDPRLLNLILKNLAENAIKFTPAGGTVTLSIGRAAGTSSVVLAVRDTGVGIPAEHVHRVFERFYQVDPARSGSAGRGTGLGLAIVKHAATALGGSVSLSSKPGEGTTVTCLLPQPV
jgi:two-component system phosphate regulon sensor histidine kinase PhoR